MQHVLLPSASVLLAFFARPRIRSGATCLPTTIMGSAPSKPLSTPAVDEKGSSQSAVEQATVRLQALNLRGLGEAASKDGTLSQANVQEWEQKAGKVHLFPWF